MAKNKELIEKLIEKCTPLVKGYKEFQQKFEEKHRACEELHKQCAEYENQMKKYTMELNDALYGKQFHHSVVNSVIRQIRKKENI